MTNKDQQLNNESKPEPSMPNRQSKLNNYFKVCGVCGLGVGGGAPNSITKAYNLSINIFLCCCGKSSCKFQGTQFKETGEAETKTVQFMVAGTCDTTCVLAGQAAEYGRRDSLPGWAYFFQTGLLSSATSQRSNVNKFLRVISVSSHNLCRVSFSSLDGDPLQTGLEWSSYPGLHSSRFYRLRVSMSHTMSHTPRIIQPFFSLCFFGFCCFPLSFESRS